MSSLPFPTRFWWSHIWILSRDPVPLIFITILVYCWSRYPVIPGLPQHNPGSGARNCMALHTQVYGIQTSPYILHSDLYIFYDYGNHVMFIICINLISYRIRIQVYLWIQVGGRGPGLKSQLHIFFLAKIMLTILLWPPSPGPLYPL
jgi:hypothetical protein